MASKAEMSGRRITARAISQSRAQIGRRGETLAVDFFMRRGYQVIARNWACRWGELDLIVRKGDDLRMVEVKTRQGTAGTVMPYEAVTDRKLARMAEAAARFLHAHPSLPEEAHFDVLAVTFTAAGVPAYQWLKDFE